MVDCVCSKDTDERTECIALIPKCKQKPPRQGGFFM